MVSAKCVLARHAVSLPEGQLQQFRQDEPLDLSTDCSLKQDSARSQKAGQPLRTHPTCETRGQFGVIYPVFDANDGGWREPPCDRRATLALQQYDPCSPWPMLRPQQDAHW